MRASKNSFMNCSGESTRNSLKKFCRISAKNGFSFRFSRRFVLRFTQKYLLRFLLELLRPFFRNFSKFSGISLKSTVEIRKFFQELLHILFWIFLKGFLQNLSQDIQRKFTAWFTQRNAQKFSPVIHLDLFTICFESSSQDFSRNFQSKIHPEKTLNTVSEILRW